MHTTIPPFTPEMDTPSTPNVGSSDSGGPRRNKKGVILRKSRAGCQDCRLRKVKVGTLPFRLIRWRYQGGYKYYAKAARWTYSVMRSSPSAQTAGGVTSVSNPVIGRELLRFAKPEAALKIRASFVHNQTTGYQLPRHPQAPW